jgi:hypothetical protein
MSAYSGDDRFEEGVLLLLFDGEFFIRGHFRTASGKLVSEPWGTVLKQPLIHDPADAVRLAGGA